jgi:DNA-binding transcriptional ArsR family regulator
VDQISVTFAALSDPTRRRIIDRLTRGPATVNELALPFKISQQAISRHIAYLENARLIEKHKDGRQQICTLKPNTIREVAKWSEKYRKFWETSYQRLDTLLEELKAEGKK